MSAYPKLIIFSDKAIPKVKSTYKGTSVEVLNLRTFEFDDKNLVHQVLLLAELFKEFKAKKATVISGITEAQLTFFMLQNTQYTSILLKDNTKLGLLHALNIVGAKLIEKHEYLKDYDNYANYFYTGLGDLPISNKSKIFNKDVALITKLYELLDEFNISLRALFYSIVDVHTP